LALWKQEKKTGAGGLEQLEVPKPEEAEVRSENRRTGATGASGGEGLEQLEQLEQLEVRKPEEAEVQKPEEVQKLELEESFRVEDWSNWSN